MRATACFSMYSDMSSRTMAFSSSNRKSASARAVSVFPTPVGPRKMNDPVGRFGSCRPARARRTALATAASASGCPTTRRSSSASSRVSRSRSDSSIFVTGIPVHFLLQVLALLLDLGQALFRLGDLALESGNPAVADLSSLLQVAATRRLLGLRAELLQLRL